MIIVIYILPQSLYNVSSLKGQIESIWHENTRFTYVGRHEKLKHYSITYQDHHLSLGWWQRNATHAMFPSVTKVAFWTRTTVGARIIDAAWNWIARISRIISTFIDICTKRSIKCVQVILASLYIHNNHHIYESSFNFICPVSFDLLYYRIPHMHSISRPTEMQRVDYYCYI